MPERDIITIGELRAETPTPAGIINPTDLMEAFRPDNPSDPGADGNSYGGTFAELAAFVLGNISVVENADGTSIRVPAINVQICWRQAEGEIPTSVEQGGRFFTAPQTLTFPQAFSAVPAVSPAYRSGNNLYGIGMHIRSVHANGITAIGEGLNSAQGIRFGYIAIGRY